MNELELKRFVERAIRPVRAEFTTKLKMREELLAHATDVLEQELGRNDGDQSAALDRTLSRLGNPSDLTAEYQSTVSRVERAATWIENRVQRRPEETKWRFAIRMSLYVAAMLVGCSVLLLGMRWPEVAAWTVRTRITLRVLAGLLFFYTIGTLLITLITSAICEQFEFARPGMRRRVICLLLAIAGSLVVFFSGWGLIQFSGGDPHGQLLGAETWIPLSAFVAPGLIAGSWYAAHEHRRRREWLELEIGA